MSKFVKISSDNNKYAGISPGSVIGMLSSGLAAGGKNFLTKNMRSFNWAKLIPALFNINSALKDNFLSKYPRYKAGIIPNIQALVKDFVSALNDPAFKEVAVAGILQLMGAGYFTEDMYTQAALQYYYETPDAYGMPIAEGGYQKHLGKMPPKEIIPKERPNDLNAKIEAIGKDPRYKTPQAKIQALNSLLGSFLDKVKPLENFTGIKL